MIPDSQITSFETDMQVHDHYMHRCIELAKLAAGYTAPNPMVGAVLVYNEKIIGEGYHQYFGGPHAEVNCINSVARENRKYISQAVLYISLEPCSHFGKTPPCTDLIIQHKISKVFIGCRDPFSEVNGKGIEKLKQAGIEVQTNVLKNECKQINKRFFSYHEQKRPYIILKWAETADGKIAQQNRKVRSGEMEKSRLFISNEKTNRLVHKWRSEEASILVGTNTALVDDPELTNRLWTGQSPIRLVVDMDLSLPQTLQILNDKQRTIIFNKIKHEENTGLFFYRINEETSLVKQMIRALYELKIQSVLVEGGARLLQSFINEGLWDEIRKIKNLHLKIGEGLSAPVFPDFRATQIMKIDTDLISIYLHHKL